MLNLAEELRALLVSQPACGGELPKLLEDSFRFQGLCLDRAFVDRRDLARRQKTTHTILNFSYRAGRLRMISGL